MRNFCAVCGNIDRLSPGWDLRVRMRETGRAIDIHRRCFDKSRYVIIDEGADDGGDTEIGSAPTDGDVLATVHCEHCGETVETVSDSPFRSGHEISTGHERQWVIYQDGRVIHRCAGPFAD